MSGHPLQLEEIWELQANGKDICGYSRNPLWDGTTINCECALSKERCPMIYLPQIMKDCKVYKAYFARREHGKT